MCLVTQIQLHRKFYKQELVHKYSYIKLQNARKQKTLPPVNPNHSHSLELDFK